MAYDDEPAPHVNHYLLIGVAQRAEEHARETSEQHLMEYAMGIRDASRFLLDGSPSEELIELFKRFR